MSMDAWIILGSVLFAVVVGGVLRSILWEIDGQRSNQALANHLLEKKV
ncbi:MAG: hypothetical protein HQL54_03555 [Magnetococcales bacterium]|nr:hypothetical protein [Magnetococcales bacterium]